MIFKNRSKNKEAILFSLFLNESYFSCGNWSFSCFRFIGGGGAPYAIQNVLPVLFDMSIKNYFISTLIGCMPSMFVTVALGSGIESVIEQNSSLSFRTVIFSPEIYIPIIIFIFIFFVALVVKRLYFKE